MNRQYEPSIITILDQYGRAGFNHNLMTRAEGRIECQTCGAGYPASEASIAASRRLEGSTNPGDETIVVAVLWPTDAPRCLGVAVLGYGPTASPEDGEVLTSLVFQTGRHPQNPPQM